MARSSGSATSAAPPRLNSASTASSRWCELAAEEVLRSTPEQRLDTVAAVFLAVGAHPQEQRVVQAIPEMVGVRVIDARRGGQRRRRGDRKNGDSQAHPLIFQDKVRFMTRRIAVILCLLGSIGLEAQQPAPAPPLAGQSLAPSGATCR